MKTILEKSKNKKSLIVLDRINKNYGQVIQISFRQFLLEQW